MKQFITNYYYLITIVLQPYHQISEPNPCIFPLHYCTFDQTNVTILEVSIDLPVKPNLKKYLLFHFDEPYELSRKDNFGNYLFTLLRHPQTDRQYDEVVRNYPGTFEVITSLFRSYDLAAKHLTSFTIVKINGFLDDCFFQELFHIVEDPNAQELNRKFKDSIELFMRKYDLDEGEDITYEGLKKKVYRYRKHYKKPNKNPKKITFRSVPQNSGLSPKAL